MAELRKRQELPEDVGSDDCLASYTHIYSPDLLKDQVAFITGGGSGIGLRIAEIFMRHGCDAVIASRNLDKLKEAAVKLSAVSGRRCLPLRIDVRQPESIVAAVDETLKEFGRLDILTNNAAGNFLCPASALSFNAFKTVLEIDTMGTFNTSKVVYEKWFKVCDFICLPLNASHMCMKTEIFLILTAIQNQNWFIFHKHAQRNRLVSGINLSETKTSDLILISENNIC
ncbi:Peroxisomal 2,4-dienoyl-CoA reductase [Ameca splendens]|uniref:Peroxisomal 2,4-dienoyl-CoA reductase [(3E)-enoyl-CoA-producing] n=1 Tax=Ameca splendens TaxID=208324 RepID=A0ABV0XYH7_9TELE